MTRQGIGIAAAEPKKITHHRIKVKLKFKQASSDSDRCKRDAEWWMELITINLDHRESIENLSFLSLFAHFAF